MAKNKKKDDGLEKTKGKRNNDLLRVSRAVKIMAAMHKVRYGTNFRQTIMAMGEAEHNYHKFGRLVLKG